MQSNMYCQRLRPAIRLRYLKWKAGSLGCLCLLLTSLLISGMGYGQSINYKGSSQSLPQLFKEIRRQTGYVASYNADDLKDAGSIKLPKGSYTLTDLLDKVLKPINLTYTIRSKTIFVSKVLRPHTPATPPKERTDLGVTRPAIKVNGRVIDENNAPLQGITVTIKNTTRGAATDGSGRFGFDNVPNDAIIAIQGVGYTPREYTATTEMLIQLQPEVSGLDDIQVIAYGTTTQRLNTGNVTTVKADEIERQPISNPIAALEGRVPGLIVSQTSGVPGSAVKVQIRGQSSLDLTRSQNDPLFIVDGVPFEAGNTSRNQFSNAARVGGQGGLSPLTLIPPGEIESIEVLKDADATAIYGSRGANGVILITTKKGKAGLTNFSLNINSGWSHIGRSVNFLNTQQYIAMRKEAFKNDGVEPSRNPNDPGFAPDITIFDTTRYTDFKRLLIGNTAHNYNIGLTVSGGNENTQFLIGTNYHRETTVFPGSFFNAIASANISLNHISKSKRFFINLTVQYAADNNNIPVSDLTLQVVNTIPNLLLYDSAGNIAAEDGGIPLNLESYNNPLYNLETRYNLRTDNLNTNLLVGYRILDNLTFRTSAGYGLMSSDEKNAYPAKSINPANPDPLPSANFGSSNIKNWIIEPQLTYTLIAGSHKWDVLAGSTFQSKSSNNLYVQGKGYTSDLMLGTISGAATITSGSSGSVYRYNAFFGRITYNVSDKYIINLTGRRDGSSRFAPENRWASFGAVAGAWLFYKEALFNDNVSFLSYGKLRTSYGKTGNDQIGDYQYLDLWSTLSTPYNGVPALIPSALYNPGYKWEINKKFEAALDLGFFKDRLLFSGAYYLNRSNNQLISYKLPIQTGFFSVVRNFPGSVQNKGFEISVITKNISRPGFKWTTSINVTLPQNKLLKFPGLAESSYAATYVIGQPLSVIRGFKYLGMDTETGVYRFEDTNGDGNFTTLDYQVWGNRDPRFYGGFQNTITVRGWELNFLFSFRKQLGVNYINQLTIPPGYIFNQPTGILDRWQTPGDISEIQRFTAGNYIPAIQADAYYGTSNMAYTDASFIKLRNVSLSYSLPASFVQRVKLSNCRLYANAQNLLTITNYKGADPEVQNINTMPPLRTIVLGLNLNF